jgi:CheY-like chemotaxis protein
LAAPSSDVDDQRPILVVEDDDATRAFLLDNLTADGFRVAGASGAGEGLRAIEVRQPALVVLDLILEDGSGLDLLDRIRAADGLASRIDPDLPVIVLTGRAGGGRPRAELRSRGGRSCRSRRVIFIRALERNSRCALPPSGSAGRPTWRTPRRGSLPLSRSRSVTLRSCSSCAARDPGRSRLRQLLLHSSSTGEGARSHAGARVLLVPSGGQLTPVEMLALGVQSCGGRAGTRLTGRPAARQARNPPIKSVTSANPKCATAAAAKLDW